MLWKAHDRDITSLALIPDLSSIVSGDVDGFVYQWDIVTGKKINTIRELSEKGIGIGQIKLSPDGKQLALSWNSSGSKGHLEVYDTEDWRIRYTFSNPTREIGIRNFTWSPDGQWLAVVSGGIHILNAQDGSIIYTQRWGHEFSTNCIAFTPDGQRFVSGGDFYDPSIALWVFPTFEKLAQISYSADGSVGFIEPYDVLHITNEEAIFHDCEGVIRWNYRTNTLNYLYQNPNEQLFTPAIQISVSGKLMAYSVDLAVEDIPDWQERYKDERWGRSRRVTRALVNVVDLDTGQKNASFEGYGDAVTAIIFAPNTPQLLTGDWEGYIRIWDL